MPEPFPSEAGRLDALATELHALAARVRVGGLDADVADVRRLLPAGWMLTITWYSHGGYPTVSAVAALPGGGTANVVSGYANTDIEALSEVAAKLRERAK